MRSLIALIKLLSYLMLCLIGITFQFLVLAVAGRKHAYSLPLLFHKITCLIFGLNVLISGKPAIDQNTVFLSNHISYLDIIILGAQFKTAFMAKKDVADWPLFGLLAKLQQTIFIDRSRSNAQSETSKLPDKIKDRKYLVIFPEGTSSNGEKTLPFKSSLFEVFLDPNLKDNIQLQPITIILSEVNKQPIKTQADRDLYAWHGDMELMPHLWAFAKTRGAVIKLVFHPPIQPSTYQDRKKLSAECHQIVSDSLIKEYKESLDFCQKAA